MAFSASNTPNCFPSESEEALLLELGHILNARHSTVFKIRLNYCLEEWSSSLLGQLPWWPPQCPNLGNLWMHSIDMGWPCQVIVDDNSYNSRTRYNCHLSSLAVNRATSSLTAFWLEVAAPRTSMGALCCQPPSLSPVQIENPSKQHVPHNTWSNI